jgi:hypothetical protein
MCIYGIPEIPQMTQITAQELARVVCKSAQQTPTLSAASIGLEPGLVGAAFVVGVISGRFWYSRNRRQGA